MASFGDLKSKIADDLDRTDLTTQIAEAVLAAVVLYEAEGFWFTETRSTAAFSTVQGQEFYGSSDLAAIATLKQIDELTVTVSGNRYPLERRTYGYLETLSVNANVSGQPSDYAYYDEQIRMYPIPDGAYPVALSYIPQLTALSSDNDENGWTTEAFELIRAAAKVDINLNVLKDDAEATRAEVQVGKQLKRLREEHSRRTASGKIVPTQF